MPILASTIIKYEKKKKKKTGYADTSVTFNPSSCKVKLFSVKFSIGLKHKRRNLIGHMKTSDHCGLKSTIFVSSDGFTETEITEDHLIQGHMCTWTDFRYSTF